MTPEEIDAQLIENNVELLGMFTAPVTRVGPLSFVHDLLRHEWLMFDPDPAYRPDWGTVDE